MDDPSPPRVVAQHERGGAAAAVELFLVFLRLGCMTFGGPPAHIAAFYEELVRRRKWLEDSTFTELVALCHFLPGPASSQVGLAIGFMRAGYAGFFAAWLGFTLPSAALMILLALGVSQGWGEDDSWVHALRLAAAAIVTYAVWIMGRTLWTSYRLAAMGLVSAAVMLWMPGAITQMAVIAVAAIVGAAVLRTAETDRKGSLAETRPRTGIPYLVALGLLLVVLPVAARLTDSVPLDIVDSFLRTGALVFGGAHVVLPLLLGEVVAPGWVSEEVFLVGYGAAQALPGPLFTISAYLGASVDAFPHGVIGGIVALIAIYIPSFLLVLGILPYWNKLRSHKRVRAALSAVGAAVVGLLLAVLYDPLLKGGVHSLLDGVWVVVALGMLFLRCPPWLVVVLSVVAAEVLWGGPLLGMIGLAAA